MTYRRAQARWWQFNGWLDRHVSERAWRRGIDYTCLAAICYLIYTWLPPNSPPHWLMALLPR